jgi:hypothetical protein
MDLHLSYTWGYVIGPLESGALKSEHDAEQIMRQKFERPVLKFCPHFSSSDLAMVPGWGTFRLSPLLLAVRDVGIGVDFFKVGMNFIAVLLGI